MGQNNAAGNLSGQVAHNEPVALGTERWVSWDQWQAEQAERIFAEARTRAKPASADHGGLQNLPDHTTSFQRSFFPQLEQLTAALKGEFVQQAQRRGWPAEAAEAFCRAKAKRDAGDPNETK